ncbi:hypothetical protein C7T35_28610 [Variovorax sp. WS11]|uniref:hypothetical protein n=1 Tax=Variovorax sp. WS11 TaxID=1105204 RepID=UPI000D0E0761|nr:hypothetical protein [Variovorax sp. WS11]NDZ13569.1 hypothetical protein [Variovorax sp. WS11]PSL81137.1 hypothetical protein C7T35_28610 [Variovorax sp. WS11]
MRLTMRPIVQTALRSLQGLAHARAIAQSRRVAWSSRARGRSTRLEERPGREMAWENHVVVLRLGMTAEELSELKIKRAIYLRMLLDSAPKRLQDWVDEDQLEDMPKSRLFEWVAYDLECLELEQIEGTMTAGEEARYVREVVEFKGFE